MYRREADEGSDEDESEPEETNFIIETLPDGSTTTR
jgi:hypothetical protein